MRGGVFPLGPLWQLADVLLTVCVGEFWSARDDSGVCVGRRGSLRAGVCPPGGAGVDGYVMKKQAGVRPGSVLVAD